MFRPALSGNPDNSLDTPFARLDMSKRAIGVLFSKAAF
jgi:hypothetical protein